MNLARLRVLLLFAGVVWLPPGAAAQSSGFRGGPAHTGTYPGADGSFGGVRWRFQTGAPVRSSPVVAAGTLFVGSSDGFLYALDAATGVLRWRAEAGSPITSSPAVSGDVVIAGTRDGRYLAFAAATGAPAWQVSGGRDLPMPWGYESGDLWTSSPAIYQSTAYLAGGDGVLRAVDLRSGQERWRADVGARLRSSPATNGRLVVLGAADGKVHAFDAATGRRAWAFATAGVTLNSANFGYDRRTVQSSPALDDSTAFVGARDGFLYAIDLATGRERWHFDHQVSWCNTSPATADGVVYAGSSDGLFVQAVSAGAGRELWRARTQGIVWGSPAVTARTVYAPDGTGRVYAFDRATGNQLWVWRSGARVFSSPVADGGTLYVGSDDGALYALAIDANRPLARAVYWDSAMARLATIGPVTALRTYLTAQGFEVLNAEQLESWLQSRAEAGEPSALVFAVDHLGSATMDAAAVTALLRRYLETGGTVVWPGSAPALWPRDNQGRRDLSTVNRAAAARLLGVRFERSNFDAVGIVSVTPLGQSLGLRPGPLAPWGADAESVTQVLAVDELGQAAAWARQVGRGWLVRIPVGDPNDGGATHVLPVKLAAELRWR